MAGATWRRARLAGTGGHEVAKNTGGRGGLGRTRLRPRDLLSISTLVKLPSTLSTLRSFMDAVNWNAAQEEISGELGHKVAILGMANSGKSPCSTPCAGSIARRSLPKRAPPNNWYAGASVPSH